MTPEEAKLKEDYRVLGLEPGATPVEVKHAFRALAKTCHPDRVNSKTYEVRAQAEEKFKRINEAYGRISRTWGKSPSSGRNASPPPSASKAKERPPAAQWQRERKQSRDTAWLKKAWRLCLLAAICAVLLFTGRTYYSPPKVELQENKCPESTLDSAASSHERMPEEPSAEIDSHSNELLSENSSAPEPPELLMEGSAGLPPAYFTIGSLSSDVLRVQGSPARVQGQTWVYGLSEIQFRNGKVWRFNNFDGSLMVRMLPRESTTPVPAYLSLESTEDDVLRVQGTPTRVEQDKWFYGFSEIKFRDGRICDYNNYFGNLRVRLQPAGESNQNRGHFTIGSSADEVIAAQGTPTSIQGSVWAYGFSYVIFRDGKVSSVSSTSSALRFLPPEDLQDGSSEGALKN